MLTPGGSPATTAINTPRAAYRSILALLQAEIIHPGLPISVTVFAAPID